MKEPVMDAAAVTGFLNGVFPQALGGGMTIERVFRGEAAIRLVAGEDALRPGGTVSGPALFALADLAAYVVILAHIGEVALAVTTSAHLNFLRRPAPGALTCTARLLKLGKRLAVTDMAIKDEEGQLVAQANMTYSLPPR